MELFDKNNINKKDKIRDNMLKAIKKFKLTNDSLHKITGLDYDWLNSYLNNEKNIHDLSLDQISFLSNLSFMLSDGITAIDNDSRLKGVIDVLINDEIFNISYETIALYSDLNVDDIKKFMKNTDSLEFNKKYKLAVTVLFLHYIFKK